GRARRPPRRGGGPGMAAVRRGPAPDPGSGRRGAPGPGARRRRVLPGPLAGRVGEGGAQEAAVLDAVREPSVRASGGVVWRPRRGGFEVVLGHRPAYDDRSLPK